MPVAVTVGMSSRFFEPVLNDFTRMFLAGIWRHSLLILTGMMPQWPGSAQRGAVNTATELRYDFFAALGIPIKAGLLD
jgi:hypothetical protein